MASSAPCLPTIGRVAYLYYFLGDPDSYNRSPTKAPIAPASHDRPDPADDKDTLPRKHESPLDLHAQDYPYIMFIETICSKQAALRRYMHEFCIEEENGMRWEYRTVKLATTGLVGGKLDETKLDAMMNELGTDGWELVAAFDTNQSYGATRDVVVVFKRPRD